MILVSVQAFKNFLHGPFDKLHRSETLALGNPSSAAPRLKLHSSACAVLRRYLGLSKIIALGALVKGLCGHCCMYSCPGNGLLLEGGERLNLWNGKTTELSDAKKE